MPRTVTGSDSALASGRLPAVRRGARARAPPLRLRLAYPCRQMSTEGAVDIDFAAEGLLDGLEGEQRAERAALLERLAADGWPLGELRRASATETLMFLPADRVIVGSERYTAAEIAQLSGVDDEFLARVRRAMGLPNPDPGE